MNAAERARLLTAQQLGEARAIGVAARIEVGPLAVRRAVRHLERVAGGAVHPDCAGASNAHSA